MNLEELVNQHYEKLNNNDLYIWDYISSHKKQCENLSIEALAKKIHISRTTIMRFAQKLGLKGYGELKILLKIENTKSQNIHSGLELIYQNYLNTMSEFKEKDFSQLISYIQHAHIIYACSSGSIQHQVASEIKRTFLEIGKLVYLIRNSSETSVYEEMISPQDIIFLISYSGENPQMISFAKKMKIRQVPLISITANKHNTLSQLSDCPFYVDTPSIANPFGPRHEGLVNYFILIDFILAKYIDYFERKDDNETGRTD